MPAAHPTTYQFNLPRTGRPTNVTLPESWYPGIQATWEKCTSKRTVDPIMGIRAIVIHATAGGSSAGAVSVMKAGTASFHWLVPDEDEPQHGQLVWACAPEARAAWHVRNSATHRDVNGGAGNCNHWSLGIEVVNSMVRDPYSEWQLQVTAQIVRKCWAKYPNLVHVVSHAKLDPARRTDPGTAFPWERFKAMVLTSTRDAVPTSVADATPAQRVRAASARVTAAASCCGG
jgi:N-acetyl-anhydromuramyl-L-alanine amidase AmpD